MRLDKTVKMSCLSHPLYSLLRNIAPIVGALSAHSAGYPNIGLPDHIRGIKGYTSYSGLAGAYPRLCTLAASGQPQ